MYFLPWRCKKNAGLSFLFRDEALAITASGKPAIIPGNSKKSELIRDFMKLIWKRECLTKNQNYQMKKLKY